jgi:signal peptidase II
VAGGALGNALDRLRSARGVVDFIDVGVGAARFWTFNVADMAITVGAIFLVIALSRPMLEKNGAGPPDGAV